MKGILVLFVVVRLSLILISFEMFFIVVFGSIFFNIVWVIIDIWVLVF